MKLTRFHIILCVVVITLSGIIFAGYIWKYQQVLDESSQLFDQHCIAINPLIIRRKQAYIDGIRTLDASGSAGMESYMAYQDQYLAAAKEFVMLETLWLKQQHEFLNRPDVAFFLDPELREAAKYQSSIFQSDLEGTKAVIAMFSEKNPDQQQKLMDSIIKADRDQSIAQEGYDLQYGQLKNRSSKLRDQFVRTPVTQCPEKSMLFPDVDQELGQ